MFYGTGGVNYGEKSESCNLTAIVDKLTSFWKVRNSLAFLRHKNISLTYLYIHATLLFSFLIFFTPFWLKCL